MLSFRRITKPAATFFACWLFVLPALANTFEITHDESDAQQRQVLLNDLQTSVNEQRFGFAEQHCNTQEQQQFTPYPDELAAFLTYCGFSQILAEPDERTLQAGYAQLQQAAALYQAPQGQLCADIRNGLASYYRIINDMPQTQRQLELGMQCVNEPRNPKEEESLDDLTNNLAWVYRRQGNLPGYLAMLRASVFQHTHQLSPEKLSISYSNLAQAYMLVGDLAKAQRYYHQSLNYANPETMQNDYLRTLLDMTRVKLALQEWQEAQQYLDKAHQFQLSAKLAIRAKGLQALLNATTGQAAFNEPEYLSSLDDIDSVFSSSYSSQSYSDWLVVLLKEQRYTLASQLIPRIEKIENKPLSVTLTIANAKLAMLLAQKNEQIKDNEVNQIFEPAFDAIIAASKQFKSNEVGMSWLSQSRTLLDHYISWLLPSKDEQAIEKALVLSERFSHIIFQRHRMALAQHQQSDVASVVAPFGLTLFSAENELLVRDQEIEKALLSNKHNTAQQQQNEISLAAIKSYLGTKRGLLKIFSLESKQCAYFFTGQYVEGQCSNTSEGVSEWLSDVLFRFHGLNTLYILPEGEWRNVAFPAMQDSRKQRYLGQELSIIRVMSLIDFFNEQQQNLYAGNVVTFTNPTNPEPTAIESDDEAVSWRAGFPPLPWTAVATHSIEQAYPDLQVQTYSGDQASTEQLLSEQVRQAYLLHIGTHAFYSPQNPDLVGLVTATDGLDGESGFVSYEQLFSHVFNSHLVVISACETEMGKSFRGIGMRSLSHGFLYQGAGATISTLWKVPDRATAKFMSLFYQALATEKGNIAQAMLIARQQLSQQRRYQDPRYWAGFVFTVTGPQYEHLAL